MDATRIRSLSPQVVIDLTLYLDHAPSSSEARQVLYRYLGFCPVEKVKLLTLPGEEWEEIPSRAPAAYFEQYLEPMDEWTDRGLWLWDGETGGWSLNIQGVPFLEPPGDDDEEEPLPEEDEPPLKEDEYTDDEPDEEETVATAASFCEIQLPVETDSEVLVALASGVADDIPFVSGHGGFAFTFDPWAKDKDFDRIYASAKRYLGVDVQDLNLTLPVILAAVKGASWLTLIGSGLWDRVLEQRGGSMPTFPPDVRLHVRNHGVVIQAGESPMLGDRNRRESLRSYAIVEEGIEPILLRNHPEFGGRFFDERATMAWFKRFRNPENW